MGIMTEAVQKAIKSSPRSAIMRIHFNSYVNLEHLTEILKNLDTIFHYTFIFERRYRRALEHLSEFRVEEDEDFFSYQKIRGSSLGI